MRANFKTIRADFLKLVESGFVGNNHMMIT
jgi:hypothetical protein